LVGDREREDVGKTVELLGRFIEGAFVGLFVSVPVSVTVGFPDGKIVGVDVGGLVDDAEGDELSVAIGDNGNNIVGDTDGTLDLRNEGGKVTVSLLVASTVGSELSASLRNSLGTSEGALLG